VNPKPDDDETRLFRDAVRNVRPLAPGAPVPKLRAPSPRARFTRADRRAALKESDDTHGVDRELAGAEELAFHREGVQSQTLRRLRRGHFPVQAELDLHGLTVAQAKEALRDFLVQALERHVRCVRIIHGKGLRSGQRGAVLKGAVNSVLRGAGRVLAYVSARQNDGGTGAVYVLLAISPGTRSTR
jgi:DNA-nicking Smr family endonuclease